MSGRWPLLVALSSCALLVSVYATMAIAIMPMVIIDLGAPPAIMQVGAYGYLLAFLGALIPAPRRQRVLLIVSIALGLVAFGLATVLWILSPMPSLLVGGRLLQALAGAVVLWAGTGLVRAAFPGPELWKAILIPAGVAVVGLLAGLLIGLIVTELFSWRVTFLLGLPLVAVALVAVLIAAVKPPAAVPDHRLPAR
ncbi:MFS transporter [Nonomuraea endophytica]|uniref:MFS family permease n=1 Tax=Nonomuraea endophytica TaxID=714136 RepID=A0A7W8AEL9_9ACTN|nr:MFS transporter [Nonomuraea endophytica]MBB5083661.1 MFS family permease [Nonomuraea endophytica]